MYLCGGVWQGGRWGGSLLLPVMAALAVVRSLIMPSGFLQMFRYATAEKVDAKENFTTEALAANLRYDPAPFIDLLRAQRLIPAGVAVDDVGVFTQVHFPSTGFVDLVIELAMGAAVQTLWVEVKVDAGEHGQQLANYLRYIADRPHTQLVTLGKHPLRSDVRHPAWRDVRAAALASARPHWHDFATFLEEIGMADEYDAPLDAQEIDSLGRAFSLLRKTAHSLEPVCRHANALWPGSDWPSTYEEVVKVLGQQFRRHARLTVHSRVQRAPAWLVVGLVRGEGSAASAVMQAWVEARPKDLATRRALGDAYQARPLGALWERPKGGWQVFRARASVPVDGAPEALEHWFNERVDELASSGMLQKLTELTKTAPVVRDESGLDDQDSSII